MYKMLLYKFLDGIQICHGCNWRQTGEEGVYVRVAGYRDIAILCLC